MIHEQGLIMTELDGTKGVYCEVCRCNCIGYHIITIKSRKAGNDLLYQHMCIECTKDTIACLQKSLMDALLIGTEVTK